MSVDTSPSDPQLSTDGAPHVVEAGSPDPGQPATSLSPVSAAALTWTAADEPRSTRFNDVYFSRDDGLAESRAVFLDGCDLPAAWHGRKTFVVAELGLGTGLNLLAVLDLWRRHRPPGGRLHLFSVEAYPMHADEARRALAAWPALGDLAALMLHRWPDWTPGFHRIDLPELDAVLDVAVGDAAWALEEWQGRADAWFLDGFSPALNPGMWSDAVLDAVTARSAPGARLATFTVAGAVRRGLSERGFEVRKLPGHGRKRERLEARLAAEPGPADAALPDDTRPTVAIVGAGIGGASVARALGRAGLTAVVLEQERPGAGGSGFPAALVTPRLDAGDRMIAGFHAQALGRASELYGQIEGAVLARGVLQLEQSERDSVRFSRISAQSNWPVDVMRVIDPGTATRLTGEPQWTGGLQMSSCLAIAPAAVLEAFFAGTPVLPGKVDRIEPSATGWRTLDGRGEVLSDTKYLVLTAGWGLSALAPEAGLKPVRGQADWSSGPSPVPAAAWGGYLVPTGQGVLFGATHDRDQTSTEVRAEDSARNLRTLAGRLPGLAADIANRPGGARAAIRATTADRLPVCGPAPGQPGLFLLGGLGSRGFCVAPLLGEHLAAQICRQPSPLPADYAKRLAPSRFSPTG